MWTRSKPELQRIALTGHHRSPTAFLSEGLVRRHFLRNFLTLLHDTKALRSLMFQLADIYGARRDRHARFTIASAMLYCDNKLFFLVFSSLRCLDSAKAVLYHRATCVETCRRVVARTTRETISKHSRDKPSIPGIRRRLREKGSRVKIEKRERELRDARSGRRGCEETRSFVYT